MNVIDCHCHVYPDKIAAKATQGILDFYDFTENSDCEAHGGTVDDMLAVENSQGVDRQIIFSVATKPEQVPSINNFIADTVKHHPGKLTGLGTLHPDSADIEKDVDEIFRLGLKGVKIHPDVQQFRVDDEKCMKMYELCEGKIPILMHTGDYRYGFSNPDNVIPVLEKFPDLTVIGAHFGGWSIWSEATERLSEYKNFYVDTSSSFHWISKETAKNLIETYGAERVLFGTDYPISCPEREFETLMNLGLGEDELDLILHVNAEKLFGISDIFTILNN